MHENSGYQIIRTKDTRTSEYQVIIFNWFPVSLIPCYADNHKTISQFECYMRRVTSSALVLIENGVFLPKGGYKIVLSINLVLPKKAANAMRVPFCNFLTGWSVHGSTAST